MNRGMERTMLLSGKVAIAYGGGGRVGGAVARTFAAEGATVFLAGRTVATLQQVADTAVFAASDRAGAMTGTIVNLTCGSIMAAS